MFRRCTIVLSVASLVFSDAGFVSAAVLYTVTGLGTLGGSGSEAFGINTSGQVVGYAQTNSGNYDAFSYSNGTMNDLGTLAGYSFESGNRHRCQRAGGGVCLYNQRRRVRTSSTVVGR